MISLFQFSIIGIKKKQLELIELSNCIKKANDKYRLLTMTFREGTFNPI
jgi:hypothetical protein